MTNRSYLLSRFALRASTTDEMIVCTEAVYIELLTKKETIFNFSHLNTVLGRSFNVKWTIVYQEDNKRNWMVKD